MLSVMPSISQDVARLAPGFKALSIVVESAPITNPEAGKEALSRACETFLANDAVWAEAHLSAWPMSSAASVQSHNARHALQKLFASGLCATATFPALIPW